MLDRLVATYWRKFTVSSSGSTPVPLVLSEEPLMRAVAIIPDADGTITITMPGAGPNLTAAQTLPMTAGALLNCKRFGTVSGASGVTSLLVGFVRGA